ncbi:MAG: hypothetical protein SF052_00625 [Bacteroidia bacterium]|nr:hypothetical protein [Bacteroidia bacterium]
MIGISSLDLKHWADKREAQEIIPMLLRRLIWATAHSHIRRIDFPARENVQTGGWDGVLELDQEILLLPKDVSFWEFGCGKDVKKKANEDYEKRTKNSLEADPSMSTFVFVTPRIWQDKERWAKNRKAEGIWKDVKVIDAQDLEVWLEISPAVAAWFGTYHLEKQPSGTQTPENFWDEWSHSPSLSLTPKLHLGGRNNESDKLLSLSLKSNLIPVQDSSQREALAFIISCFKNNEDRAEDFFGRSIIVDDPATFRELVAKKSPLCLIPRFEDEGLLNLALKNGHVVIVPLGADASKNWGDIIMLPAINRAIFVDALVESGATKEQAEKYSRESIRNITVLRRQLGFARGKPLWAQNELVRDLIPSLIIGRWDESVDGDKIIVSQISGAEYDQYIKKLNRWTNISDYPIRKIGSLWRLTSPLDAWTNASLYLSKADFESLQSAFLETLGEINPTLELPSDRRMFASLYGARLKYSNDIKEGLTQSLILISIFGERFKFDTPIPPSEWVDNLIYKLLDNSDPTFWKSINLFLPLIAEASPSSFLGAVEKQLLQKDSPIQEMLVEDEGLLIPIGYHTGLLWGLEGIAWMRDYLLRVTHLLIQLDRIDPGGRLGNRPMGSLINIFTLWDPQTFASSKDRMQVLEYLGDKDLDGTWNLLMDLLSNLEGGVSSPTHKMRWRHFEKSYEPELSLQELSNSYSALVDLALNLFDNSEAHLANLLRKLTGLQKENRDKILQKINIELKNVRQVNFTAWHEVRHLLSTHRSASGADWVFSNEELSQYETIYNLLAPADDVQRLRWLFDEYWPQFPEGQDRANVGHIEMAELINQKREGACAEIYSNYGLTKIIEMALSVKEPQTLGLAAAKIVTEEDKIIKLCSFLEYDYPALSFIQSFVWRKSFLHDLDWVFRLYNNLKEINFSEKALGNLFVRLNQSQKLWDFVSAQNLGVDMSYWQSMPPFFYDLEQTEIVYGLKKLIEFKRFNQAVYELYMHVKKLPTEIITYVLDKAVTEPSQEKRLLDSDQLDSLFKELDTRKDIERSTLVRLEFLYLPILAPFGLLRYRNSRSTKLLHEELAQSPEFFINILKWLYKPENDRIEEETKNLSDVQIRNTAQRSQGLLSSWRRVPGVSESGEINKDNLFMWIDKAREIAKEVSRGQMADHEIGKILAQYPEEKGKNWPPIEICMVIENANSQSMLSGFSTATYNKRGTFSKDAFEGGEQERQLARKFRAYSKEICLRFPNVSQTLEKLAQSYDRQAKDEDNIAEKDSLEY